MLFMYGLVALVNLDLLWPTRSWVSAVIVGIVVVLMIVSVGNKRAHSAAAGADWLKQGRKWVDTYDLKSIRVSHGGPGPTFLYLRDHSDRKLGIDIALAHADRKLWNLVYNGMAHSVAYRNAELKGRAHRWYLHLERFRPVETGTDDDG